MTERSHQHYIPQFYLRGFVDPCCPKRHEPFVWVYNRGCATPRRRAPKNIAAESHFYSVGRENGKKDTKVEEMLSLLESNTAPLWGELDNPARTLSSNEQSIIAEFVACMSNRVPATRARMNTAVNETSKMMLRVLAAHYDDLSESQRQETGLSREDLIQAVNDDSLRFESSQSMHVQTMLYVVPRLTPIIRQMKWAFLHSPPQHAFITSDQPVTLVNPQIPPQMGGSGFGVRGIEVTLPVSIRVCMLLTWEGPVGHVDIDQNKVSQINRQTASLAHQRAFASAQLSWLGDLFAKNEGDQLRGAG